MVAKFVDKDAKKLEIAKAAMKVFANKGIPNTTMQDIADEADIGKGTLYEYFENKQAIIETAYSYFYQLYTEFIKEKTKDIKDPVEIIQSIFYSMVEFQESIPQAEIYVLIEYQLNKYYESRDNLLHEHDHYVRENLDLLIKVNEFFQPVIQEGINQQKFRKDISAKALSLVLLSALAGVNFLWIFMHTEIDLPLIVKNLLDSILNGITYDKGV
jgi:AcrR family transcriptional regulator